MPAYRFYGFEKNGCVAAPPTIYQLPNDAAALKEAEKILDDRRIEIWRRGRKIGLPQSSITTECPPKLLAPLAASHIEELKD